MKQSTAVMRTEKTYQIAWVMQYAQERIQPFYIQQIRMHFLVVLLLVLTRVTTMMMHVIGNNIALLLGMVGEGCLQKKTTHLYAVENWETVSVSEKRIHTPEQHLSK